MGPAATPSLTKALKDRDAKVRTAVAKALGEIRPKTETTIPARIELLADTDQAVVGFALLSLTRIGPEAKAAIPAIASIIKDGSRTLQLRAAAAEALASIGPTAVPSLTGLLKDKSSRGLAMWGITMMGNEAKGAEPA